MIPLFYCGQFLPGQAFEFVFLSEKSWKAQVKGAYWRLPSGEIHFVADPKGNTINGYVCVHTDELVKAAEVLLGKYFLPVSTLVETKSRSIQSIVLSSNKDHLQFSGAKKLKTTDLSRILRKDY